MWAITLFGTLALVLVEGYLLAVAPSGLGTASLALVIGIMILVLLLATGVLARRDDAKEADQLLEEERRHGNLPASVDADLDKLSSEADVTADRLLSLLATRFGAGATYERYASAVTHARRAIDDDLADVRASSAVFTTDALADAFAHADGTPADGPVGTTVSGMRETMARDRDAVASLQRLYGELLRVDDDDTDVAGEIDALVDGLDAYRRLAGPSGEADAS